MNELQFGNRIRQILDEGTRLDAHTTERLRAARELALERRRLAPAGAPAYAGGGLGSIGDGPRFSRSLLVAAVLLALGLAFVYSAQQKRRVAETVELDTQLLSDELPIDAYLDKGFEAWLKKHRQH
ncbi:MAG: DUF3619 family protein [Betaproteobacteria bacterium]|jgi:hypothetical protein|nr:DUF3619 family protein [Betaproteobacteria bacterium]